MRLSFFGGLRPFSRSGAMRDAVAGVTLASMNISQRSANGMLTLALTAKGFPW
jgi:hypothetical protein